MTNSLTTGLLVAVNTGAVDVAITYLQSMSRDVFCHINRSVQTRVGSTTDRVALKPLVTSGPGFSCSAGIAALRVARFALSALRKSDIGFLDLRLIDLKKAVSVSRHL